MRNLDGWKDLIEEIMGKKIEYNDKVSLFVPHNGGYVVVESEGRSGLQMQFRRSVDHADIVITENIVAHGKIVSELAPGNYDDVKKVLAEFVSKL